MRDSYRAFQTADRKLIERCLGDELNFYSPPDPGIDRHEYFERCWPQAGDVKQFDIKRLVESGN